MPMAVVWTHIVSAASRLCEQTKLCATAALPLKEETKSGDDERLEAAKHREKQHFGALLLNLCWRRQDTCSRTSKDLFRS